MKVYFITSFILLVALASGGDVPNYAKVDQDIMLYDQKISKMNEAFDQVHVDFQNKEWVKRKLDHMFEVDQFMRNYIMNTPFDHKYTEAEKQYALTKMSNRWEQIDGKNTADLKNLLKIYDWIKISEFGEKYDRKAWLIVQHADRDMEFQSQVLAVLENLYPVGETSRPNYAYLYDRVAASWGDISKRKPQRYGTQGQCVGPGQWEPISIEIPEKLDERRKEMGLSSEAEYKEQFKNICH